MKEKEKLNKAGVHTLLDPYFWLIIQVVVLFVFAGRMDILQAWIYFFVCIIVITIVDFFLLRFAINLLNVRGGIPKDTKTWDKPLLLVLFSCSLFFVPLVAGLDIRFQWFILDFFDYSISVLEFMHRIY